MDDGPRSSAELPVITDNMRERHFAVDHNFEGWRLDRFLANRIPRLSRSFAGRIARHGDVSVVPHRAAVKPSTRLLLHDIVILREQLEPEAVQDDEASVLYHDDSLLVVNKPAGMLVHENASTRLNTMTLYLKRQGFGEAEPVHRLDRETSGVLVCAAHRSLVPGLRMLFATSHPEKVYRALVLDPQGRWEPGTQRTLTTPLGQDRTSTLSIKMGHGDLESITHVEALARVEHPFGAMADLKIRIETGRQHQIRVHLALENTPVAGDKLYSLDDEFFMDICDRPDDPVLLARLPFARQALHAWQIRLPHPTSGDAVSVEAPLPRFWPGGPESS